MLILFIAFLGGALTILSPCILAVLPFVFARADRPFDAQGRGTIDSHRLYQLVRQKSNTRERLFEIEFQDPGVQAYAFTFG